jgi:hypothetical protein
MAFGQRSATGPEIQAAMSADKEEAVHGMHIVDAEHAPSLAWTAGAKGR